MRKSTKATPPKSEPAKVEPVEDLPEVEAVSIVHFPGSKGGDGLWHHVELTIKGDRIIKKTVGVGDAFMMAIERGVARLVGFAERQR